MKTVSWNNNRGSVLIVAIIFATVMALSVGSFLKLANSESRLASVAFHSNSALNLAEAGVERALYALNNYGEDASWPGWSGSGSSRALDVEEIDLGGNIVGYVNARVDLTTPNRPIVQVGGKVVLPNRPDVEKQLQVSLSRRSLFANGITTKRGVRMRGKNVRIDSYDSRNGKPHPIDNRFDNGSVATVAVTADYTVDVSNNEIYGRVATGGPWPNIGNHGRIYGADTPEHVDVDPERVALDFDADFPEVLPPTNLHPNPIRGSEIGDPSAITPTFYMTDKLSPGSPLIINGPVIVYVTGDININGNSEIRITETGSATFYVGGNISIGGNGAVNETNVPANLVIFGTGSSQYFTLGGNAELQAAVYAPNATVDVNGGGNSGMMAGAVVADRVYMNGNTNFHYDEALADFFLSDTGYGMDRWRELFSASDRIEF